MSLTVRPASIEDAEPLAELAAEAFRATYTAVAEAAAVEAVVEQACTPSAFRRLVQRTSGESQERLWVAVEDGRILAFLDFGTEPEGLELRRLYTRVGLTGRGIGSTLLKKLESSLPVGTRFRIVVLSANQRAIAFWTRHGFRSVAEIDAIDHFAAHRGVSFASGSRPEPLLIMERVVGSRLP